jgi:hypothetical protein
VERRLGTGCRSVVRHPHQYLLETDGELQSCEDGAEAAMYTGSESEMPVRRAIEDAPVRLGELLRVAVGRGVVDHNRFAGGEGMSARLDFLGNSSMKAANRSCKANEFFEGPWQNLGFADQSVAFSGMCCR